MDRIGGIFSRCMHECDEESCETECIQSFKESKKNCPCEVNITKILIECREFKILLLEKLSWWMSLRCARMRFIRIKEYK